MKKRKLGRTNLQVSELGFGSWAIGGTSYGPTDDRESLKALAYAFDQGINFFNTADTYGYGHSEELIGEVFQQLFGVPFDIPLMVDITYGQNQLDMKEWINEN